jgi:hypothetical protein
VGSIPIRIKEINPHSSYGLLDLAAFRQQQRISNFREAEKKGAGFALSILLGQAEIELEYEKSGRPFLRGRMEHISISHSHGMLAVLVNRKESTGVDIELIDSRVLGIAPRFLASVELQYCGKDVNKLIRHWAAKETLYKLHALRGLDFRKDIFIEETSDGLLHGTVKAERTREFILAWEIIDGYMLVYALNEVR